MNRYTPEQYKALMAEFADLKDIAFKAGQKARAEIAKGTNSYARGKKDAYDSFYDLFSDKVNLFTQLHDGLMEDKSND